MSLEMDYDPEKFVEKFLLAREISLKENPPGGLCGLELEWNLLDSQMRPLLTVGSGPSQQSFVDFLRAECLSAWLGEFSQLEVFHWMIEWATRPYYYPRGAVYEARLLEATLLNGLAKAGGYFGERLYYWYGNLLHLTEIGHHSIPGSWHLAKRRYLERCVELYGDTLATAGTHANLSLPDALLVWDFVHLPPGERSNRHLDDYKNQFYVAATRCMRAFAALSIAISASTPIQAQIRSNGTQVVLTEYDSIRNLTFPNPENIDLPDLYRSYQDYLEISNDLVRRGVRFGNNNWTPVRARSFAEPVERLIAVTSEQLHDLYARGLYSVGEERPVNEMAHQIEIQNLLARIHIPMSRVEVRTDDGGHTLEEDIAYLTLKHLLMLRFYADPQFCRAFRYDREDIQRARRNETKAALYGLRAEIEHPLTGKPVMLRQFLNWTLSEVRPLAEFLGLVEDLASLVEMASGAPNTAERLREHLRRDYGVSEEIPLEVLSQLAREREAQVVRDCETIAGLRPAFPGEWSKLSDFLQRSRDDIRRDPEAPVRFRPEFATLVDIRYPDKTTEIVDLSCQLIRIPSVTACPQERLEEVHRAATFIYDYLVSHGVGVRLYNQSKYPSILAGFPGQMHAPVMLGGHFDVVAPDPDDSQFEPRLEGDYLWGRGSADMKTVLATYLVWFKDRLQEGPPYPPINLLLVGNEENGELEPMGTPHILRLLADEDRGYFPKLFIAGERTGERGDETWGEICVENRGVMRFEITLHGSRDHTGTAAAPRSLVDQLFELRDELSVLFQHHLTLANKGGWQTQARFAYLQAGTTGVFNIAADQARLGVEVRSIPQDDLSALKLAMEATCQRANAEIEIQVMENGVVCDPNNPYLQALLQAVRHESGSEPALGKKLAGTSARFAPGEQGVVWGQSGIGPHAPDERHYITSILPYYRALSRLARVLLDHPQGEV